MTLRNQSFALLCFGQMLMAFTTQARPLVTINFDAAPFNIPQNYYSSQGMSRLALINGNMGPSGDGTLSLASPPPGAPPPASGMGITPYANLAGYLSSFEMVFAPAIDYFSLWAFDGPQAFTVQAFRFGTQVAQLDIPAEAGRMAIELPFGTIGGAARYDRIVVNPVPGIGGSDPNRGPKYYDELRFNSIPGPGGLAVLATVGIGCGRRRRGAAG